MEQRKQKQGPRRHGLQPIGLTPPREGERIVSILLPPGVEPDSLFCWQSDMRTHWMAVAISHKSWPLDLWTNPVGVASLLATCVERMGGPQ